MTPHFNSRGPAGWQFPRRGNETAPTRPQHACELAERRRGVIDVAEEVGERHVIERCVTERQPFRAGAHDAGEQAIPIARRGEHFGALIQADNAAGVPLAERARDEAGPGRDIENELAWLRLHRCDECAAPAGILTEGEDRGDPIVGTRDPGKDAGRIRRRGYGAKSFSPLPLDSYRGC